MLFWSPQSHIRLSLSCEISCPLIVPSTFEIVRLTRNGSVDDVRELLSKGRVAPTIITSHGISLLHIAVRANHIELVKLLLREGADVNASEEDGETPLHWATAQKDGYEIARTLVENGADIGNVTVDGRTPLHTIYTNTVGSMIKADHLLEDTFADSRGMSLSHYLAWSGKTPPNLFERGRSHDRSSVWARDELGRTCLHLAAQRGNLKLLKHLLALGSSSDLETIDNHGLTVAHHAMQCGNCDVLDYLLEMGADVKAQDKRSRNILHHAIQWGNVAAVKKMTASHDYTLLTSVDANGQLPLDLIHGEIRATNLKLLNMSEHNSTGIRSKMQPTYSILNAEKIGILKWGHAVFNPAILRIIIYVLAVLVAFYMLTALR